jgi:putative spermidine/putrescine transport system permease protein
VVALGFGGLLTGAALFLALPLAVSVVMSLDARDYLGPFPPPALSLQWYRAFLGNRYYLDGLATSLLVATVASVASTVLGTLAAVALDRASPRRQALLATLFQSPLVIPGVVAGFALLLFFSGLRVYDGLVRLILAHVVITLPFTVRTAYASLTGIRRHLTDAAMSLGAHEVRAFWDVTLPLAKTGIAAGSIFAFVISFEDVSVSLFLTDPRAYTLPVAMLAELRASFDLTIGAISTVLMVLTVLVIGVLDWLIGLERVMGLGVYRS